MTQDAYDEVLRDREPHEAELSHELIAGAASYAAMKAYNEHAEKSGAPVSHAKAKELLAAVSGAVLDGLLESKGRDYYDKFRAERNEEE